MNEPIQPLSVKEALAVFFTRQDRILVVLAGLALVIVAVLTPFTRNQSELNTRLEASRISELNETFLTQIGYQTSGYLENISVKRETDLLNELNFRHGSTAVTEASRTHPELKIPVYHYEVNLRPTESGDFSLEDLIHLMNSGNADSKIVNSLFYPSF